jgi:putative GTP pyrophosphokinase
VQAPAITLTKSQVNKAGQVLRRRLRSELVAEDALAQALDVLLAYRAAHQYPLTKATMGLRSVVRTEGFPIEVSQRLKRLTTIFDKLQREPTMALANMQDIGGCRAVLNSIAEIRRVEQRLKRNRPPLAVSDYITHPRPSGYRGVHVVVAYADRESEHRTIEVQLRTQTMHQWAIVVERLSGRLRADLNSGQGPAEVLALLAAISEAMAMEERGEAVPRALVIRMNELRQAAVPYLGGPS